MTNSSTKWIPLDSRIVEPLSISAIHSRIREIVCSVRFELYENGSAFRILGPDMPYHDLDPFLLNGLTDLSLSITHEQIFNFRKVLENYSLTFEDSWCGELIAKSLEHTDGSNNQPLILIHLDDHTDMMPSLLAYTPTGIVDPFTGHKFMPEEPADWEDAITSGSVSIGNFVTPLYHLQRPTKVYHLCSSQDQGVLTYSVYASAQQYDIIPNIEFVSLKLSSDHSNDNKNTYSLGNDPFQLFKNLPDGLRVVHIDLDYFINDFNGNEYEGSFSPSPHAKEQALQKMNNFFDTIYSNKIRIDDWVIGISPGFCSGIHWAWLLKKIQNRIQVI